MSWFGPTKPYDPWNYAPEWAWKLHDQLNRMEKNMATKEQLDKLRTDVAALIDAGVAEIKAAVAAAQGQSPDSAIDELDDRVNEATRGLVAASEALKNPNAQPA